MTPRHLRILFAIRALANPGGGAERVLEVLTRRLVQRGHEVGIITFDEHPVKPFYDFDPRVRLIGIGIGDPSRSARVLESLRRVLPLRRESLAFRPDVAVGFMHSMYVPIGVALISSGIPVVATEHIPMDYYLAKPWWHKAMLRIAPLTAVRVTVPTAAVKRTFGPRIANQMTVIANPVSKYSFNSETVEREKRVVAIGRLFAQKDHRLLISAFARLAKKHSGWQLEILGDGELRDALISQADEAGIASSVHFRGAVADVNWHLQRASIFAMPSRYESFGLATGEALAAGVPAVGFADCLGTNELIIDGVNGLLVPGATDDAQRIANLAEGLDRLMSDEKLRSELGAAGPRTLERFDPELVADLWEELLIDVIRR
jgi:glycosyltransferase involved in cell wall biosynthesis